jgi:hypothetical protein
MYLTAYSPVADFFEYGHEPSACKGLTNFLDHLRKYIKSARKTLYHGARYVTTKGIIVYDPRRV